MTGPVIQFPTSRTIREGVVEPSTDASGGRPFTYEVPAQPDGRAERGELLGCLVGAVAILDELKDPIGRAYRDRLVARIRSIIERENRFMGAL